MRLSWLSILATILLVGAFVIGLFDAQRGTLFAVVAVGVAVLSLRDSDGGGSRSSSQRVGRRSTGK